MQALLGGLMGGGQPSPQMMEGQPQEQREDQAKWQKFQAPPNEMLDKEGSYKDMKPTNKDISKFIQKNLQSAILNAANPQEKAVYQQIVKQLEVDESKEKFTDLYNETFIEWLLGKSHYNRSKKDLYLEWSERNRVAGVQSPNGQTLGDRWNFLSAQPSFEKFLESLDFNPTPWGNKDISFLPGCKEFLDGIVDKRAEVERYFSKMALNGPRNITDAWMIYKYMIHKNEIDDTIIDYAKSIVGPYEMPSQDQLPIDMYGNDAGGAPFDINDVVGQDERIGGAYRYGYKYFYVGEDGLVRVNSSRSHLLAADRIPADIPPPYSLQQTKQKLAFIQYSDLIFEAISGGNQLNDILNGLSVWGQLKKGIMNQMDPLEGIYFEIEMTHEMTDKIREFDAIVQADANSDIVRKRQVREMLMAFKSVFPEIKLLESGGVGSAGEPFSVQGNIAANIEAAIQKLGEKIVDHLRVSGLRPTSDQMTDLRADKTLRPSKRIGAQLQDIWGATRKLYENNPDRSEVYGKIASRLVDIRSELIKLGNGSYKSAFGKPVGGADYFDIDEDDGMGPPRRPKFEEEKEEEEEEEEEKLELSTANQEYEEMKKAQKEMDEMEEGIKKQAEEAEEAEKESKKPLNRLMTKIEELIMEVGKDPVANNLLGPPARNLSRDIVAQVVQNEVKAATSKGVGEFFSRGIVGKEGIKPAPYKHDKFPDVFSMHNLISDVFDGLTVKGISETLYQDIQEVKNNTEKGKLFNQAAKETYTLGMLLIYNMGSSRFVNELNEGANEGYIQKHVMNGFMVGLHNRLLSGLGGQFHDYEFKELMEKVRDRLTPTNHGAKTMDEHLKGMMRLFSDDDDFLTPMQRMSNQFFTEVMMSAGPASANIMEDVGQALLELVENVNDTQGLGKNLRAGEEEEEQGNIIIIEEKPKPPSNPKPNPNPTTAAVKPKIQLPPEDPNPKPSKPLSLFKWGSTTLSSFLSSKPKPLPPLPEEEKKEKPEEVVVVEKPPPKSSALFGSGGGGSSYGGGPIFGGGGGSSYGGGPIFGGGGGDVFRTTKEDEEEEAQKRVHKPKFGGNLFG